MDNLLFLGPIWGFLFHEALRFFPYADSPVQFIREHTARYVITGCVLVGLSMVFATLFGLETPAERIMIGFSITSGIGILKGIRSEKLDSDDHFNHDVKGVSQQPAGRSGLMLSLKKRLDEYYWY